jgi:hypothetical protein
MKADRTRTILRERRLIKGGQDCGSKDANRRVVEMVGELAESGSVQSPGMF